jgi:hypothetical protein
MTSSRSEDFVCRKVVLGNRLYCHSSIYHVFLLSASEALASESLSMGIARNDRLHHQYLHLLPRNDNLRLRVSFQWRYFASPS